MCRSGRFGALAVLFTLALTAPRARAQVQEPTLLVYLAPPECPAVGDFQRSVERRSSRIHFVDEGSHARELSIFLRKDGDFMIGELRLIEENGSLRQRSVRFPSCADAVEGLALIATVSLDPQALLENPKPVPQTPPPTTASSETKPPPPVTPPPQTPTARPKPPTPPPPKPPPKKTGLEVGVGAEGNAFFKAFIPQTAFGGSVFADIGSSSRRLLSPHFRGAFSYVQRLGVSGADPTAGRADARLALLTFYGCPLAIGGDTLVFRPCAALAGGGLYTRGREPNVPHVSVNPQLAVGGAALIALHFAQVVEVVADFGVGVPMIHDQFGFTNDGNSGNFESSWTTPSVYVSSGLGFRLLLP